MRFENLIKIIVLFLIPLAHADIIFLGDNARIQLLKQCGVSCTAVGNHKIITPKLNARASDVATLAQDASHAVIVIDATQGPLPIIREHTIIARQAGVMSLSIMFVNTLGLEGLPDAKELLELEEKEVRELLKFYEMGGDNTLVFYDNSLKSIPSLQANTIGINSVLSKLKSIPTQQISHGEYFTGKSFNTYTYLLTHLEAKYTKSLMQGSSVNLWINGQFEKGKVISKGIEPGDNGYLQIILEKPVKAANGSRFLLENNGQIIAIGVVVNIGNPS